MRRTTSKSVMTLALLSGIGTGFGCSSKDDKKTPKPDVVDDVADDDDGADDDDKDVELPAGFTKGSLLLTNFCDNASGQGDYDLRNKVNKDVAAFAADLTKAVLDGKSNGVLSPLSVQYAFAMLDSGATGATKAEIESTLHLGKGGYDVGAGFKELSAGLRCPSDTETKAEDLGFHLANAVWGSKANPLAEAFVTATHETYAAEAQTLDFADGAASAKAINDWSNEATYGKIPSVVEPDQITTDLSFILTNAVHYKAKWEHEFDKAATKDDDFNVTNGSKVLVPTMQMSEVEIAYLAGATFTAVRLPYQDGDSMTIVVPKTNDGLPALLANLDMEELMSGEAWDSYRVNLWLPKFKVEIDTGLVKPLKELGMTKAFAAGDELAEILSTPSPVSVTDVYQKAYIDVHEEGTEAAAVTVVMVGDSAAMPEEKPIVDLHVDRPFFYMIERRGSVIFTGTVVDPRG